MTLVEEIESLLESNTIVSRFRGRPDLATREAILTLARRLDTLQAAKPDDHPKDPPPPEEDDPFGKEEKYKLDPGLVDG